MAFTSLFHSTGQVPDEYRPNFRHLTLDMGWFGVLSGSSLAFLAVYAARLGANGFQIGLLGAMPAVMNLVFAIPAGRWLQQEPISKAVFWTSILYRLGYLLFIPLPWLFHESDQVWALVSLSLLMGIPGTALAVGFNALFAEAVPRDWRAHVAGIRNVVLSVVYISTSLVSGWILNHINFPTGYQVVFGIGALGAAMSSYHLFHVKPLTIPDTTPSNASTGGQVRPGRLNAPGSNLRADINFHSPARKLRVKLLRTDIWQTPFRSTLLVLLAFHLAQYLAVPIFPIYFVHSLQLNDQQIGIGTAMFYLTVLIGSTQLTRLTRRLDHRRVTGLGVVLLSIYPILLSLSHGFGLYLLTSSLGGFSWSLVSGALANYLLEKIPAVERPPYLAWYNIILNASILIGSLSGPIFADWLGLSAALTIFGILRLLAGLSILRWG
jgi:MFS family permease